MCRQLRRDEEKETNEMVAWRILGSTGETGVHMLQRQKRRQHSSHLNLYTNYNPPRLSRHYTIILY